MAPVYSKSLSQAINRRIAVSGASRRRARRQRDGDIVQYDGAAALDPDNSQRDLRLALDEYQACRVIAEAVSLVSSRSAFVLFQKSAGREDFPVPMWAKIRAVFFLVLYRTARDVK
jgi:hypothetical protein